MATTPISNTTAFVLLVPNTYLVRGPAGDPWRPDLHTFDVEAAIAGEIAAVTWEQVLAVGNTTGLNDAVITGGQALRGAPGSTLTLVGPTGVAITATTGSATLGASAGDAGISASGQAIIIGGTFAQILSGGSASIAAVTTASIATASGTTLSNTAADTTPVLTLTSGGANGATTAIRTGNRATPEGAVTASPGDAYRSNTGTAGTLWTKVSGVATNTGWVRMPIVSNAGTTVSAPSLYTSTVTTDANGDFTVDYSALGFTSFARIWVQGIRNTTTVTDMVWASIRTRTLTTAAGTVIEGVTVGILGAPSVARAPAGLSVDVWVVGA